MSHHSYVMALMRGIRLVGLAVCHLSHSTRPKGPRSQNTLHRARSLPSHKLHPDPKSQVQVPTRLQPYTLVSPVASAQRPDRVTVAIRLGLQCCLVSAEWVEGERQENPRLKPLKTAKNFRLWRGPPGPARDVKR